MPQPDTAPQGRAVLRLHSPGGDLIAQGSLRRMAVTAALRDHLGMTALGITPFQTGIDGYLMSFRPSRKVSVPAFSSHSNTTISVVTMLTPAIAMRAMAVSLDKALRDDMASTAAATS